MCIYRLDHYALEPALDSSLGCCSAQCRPTSKELLVIYVQFLKWNDDDDRESLGRVGRIPCRYIITLHGIPAFRCEQVCADCTFSRMLPPSRHSAQNGVYTPTYIPTPPPAATTIIKVKFSPFCFCGYQANIMANLPCMANPRKEMRTSIYFLEKFIYI